MHPNPIATKIHQIRGSQVMFDFDLADLYAVETRVLKQAVKRNFDRFPGDFMYQLTQSEWTEVITTCDNLPQKIKFSPVCPMAFTEQGIAMLSSVLRSEKAIQVNIAIMRVFVFIRQNAHHYHDLSEKLKALETKYDKQFTDVFDAIRYLLHQEEMVQSQQERKRIGYKK